MTKEVDKATVEMVTEWVDDPVAFVKDMFDAEPDDWQAKVLRDITKNRRLAMVACKGPGKSCVMAWLIWWIMFCNEGAQGFALSITGDNLKDGLWKELAYWYQKAPALIATFEITAKRISSRLRPKYWFCSARSFPQQADKEQQANTLAGLHGRTPFIVLDEVGDYPHGVLAAAEGIFATKADNPFLIVGGNPTNQNGPLYKITTKNRKRWLVTHITGDPEDPMRSPRIDLKWAQDAINEDGRDNPWVMVNVLGQFPPSGSNQLININWVESAQERAAKPKDFQSSPIIWGLDPGRFGDDESALARRQGIVMYRINRWRGLDGVELGNRISKMLLDAQEDGDEVDALFVDVGGIGASVYDHLKLLGWGKILSPIDFGGSPDDDRYVDKRTEMWWHMAQWLKKMPANLPTDPILASELTAPEYGYKIRQRQTKFVLESKDSMRSRGIPSPNRADALALTFAAPVSRHLKKQAVELMGSKKMRTEYDPFDRSAEIHRPSRQPYYDPFQRA